MIDPHMFGDECWSFVAHLTYSAGVDNSPKTIIYCNLCKWWCNSKLTLTVILAVSSWLWLWLVSDFLMSALLMGRPTIIMPRLSTPFMCPYMYSSFLCPADNVTNAQQQCHHIGAYDSCIYHLFHPLGTLLSFWPTKTYCWDQKKNSFLSA